MKKFITKDILPDLLSDLADEFIENSDKIAIGISLIKFTDNCRPTLKILVQQKGTWDTLAEESYDIIDKTHDGFDVVKATVDEALTKI